MIGLTDDYRHCESVNPHCLWVNPQYMFTYDPFAHMTNKLLTMNDQPEYRES